MLSGLNKERLIFDPSYLNDADNVGAYVRSSDGTLITHTHDSDTSKDHLDVAFRSEYEEDTAHTSGDWGNFVLAVRHDDDDTPLVDTDGDYTPLITDEYGRLKVSATLDINFDYVYPEDSAHQDEDDGAFVLAVRQDTLATSVDTDGDYAAFKLNSRGGLWTVPVGTVDDDDAVAAHSHHE